MSDEAPKIEARLGDLEVSVKGESLEEAEEVFEEVWQRRLEETQESTDAMRALSRGYE